MYLDKDVSDNSKSIIISFRKELKTSPQWPQMNPQKPKEPLILILKTVSSKSIASTSMVHS